jgi:hypothetical protein
MVNYRYLFLVFFLLFSTAARADECTRFNDSDFKYSICVPGEWGKSYRDIGYKHVLTLSRKNGAEITVSATRYDDEEKMKWASWKKWYVQGIGSNLMNIVETGEFAAGRDTVVRILVFDFKAHGRRLVQRTMIARHGGSLLVVECRAPVGTFSRYTGLFNTVMSSVDFTGSLAGEKIDFLKEPEGGKGKKEWKKKSGDDRGGEIQFKKKKTETETIEPNRDKGEKKSGGTEHDGTFGENKNRQAVPEMDSETRKVIQEQLKKIQDLENRGIIEKIDDEQQEK